MWLQNYEPLLVRVQWVLNILLFVVTRSLYDMFRQPIGHVRYLVNMNVSTSALVNLEVWQEI